MIKYLKSLINAFISLVLFCFMATANLTAQNRYIPFFDLQDDFLHFRGHGTDRYYSGGLSLGLSCDLDGPQRKIHVFSINQRIFTPSDISQTAIIPGDYPYQGLLYLSFTQHRFLTAGRIFSWSAAAGTTGPYAWAKEFQSEFHRWIGYKKPLGWDNAVSLGHYLQATASIRVPLYSNNWLFVAGGANAEFGSVYNRMGISAEIKLGNQMLPFLEHAIHLIPGAHSNGFQMHFFAVPALDFIVYNRLLESGLVQDVHDPHGLAAIQVASWLGRFSAGFHFRFGRFSILAMQHAQTREFAAAKSHHYGQVMFLYML